MLEVQMNKKISFLLPIEDYKKIKMLVKEGRYKSINNFIQIAIKNLLRMELGINISEKDLKVLRKILGI